MRTEALILLTHRGRGTTKWWRGRAAAEIYPASPLHHAAHGPPPPAGEERQAVEQTRINRQ